MMEQLLTMFCNFVYITRSKLKPPGDAANFMGHLLELTQRAKPPT